MTTTCTEHSTAVLLDSPTLGPATKKKSASKFAAKAQRIVAINLLSRGGGRALLGDPLDGTSAADGNGLFSNSDNATATSLPSPFASQQQQKHRTSYSSYQYTSGNESQQQQQQQQQLRRVAQQRQSISSGAFLQLQQQQQQKRPATCERNLRDLNQLRAETENEYKAMNACIDEETIQRKQVENSEYENRDIFMNRHAKIVRYLRRLELNEQVKKATVDKQNEKIHSLFTEAQSEERKQREDRRVEEIQLRAAKAREEKQSAHKRWESVQEKNTAVQRKLQEEIAHVRLEAKKQRAVARFDLLLNKRENAQKIAKESDERARKQKVKKDRLEAAHKAAADPHKSRAVPIHSFLRLPPLKNNNTSNNASNNSMPSYGTANGGDSNHRNHANNNNYVDDDDDDDDPYNLRDHRSYQHTSITAAIAGLGTVMNPAAMMKKSNNSSCARDNNKKRREAGVVRAIAAPNAVQSRTVVKNAQQQQQQIGGSSGMGTQTNDDWIDTLPSESDSSSSDGE